MASSINRETNPDFTPPIRATTIALSWPDRVKLEMARRRPGKICATPLLHSDGLKHQPRIQPLQSMRPLSHFRGLIESSQKCLGDVQGRSVRPLSHFRGLSESSWKWLCDVQGRSVQPISHSRGLKHQPTKPTLISRLPLCATLIALSWPDRVKLEMSRRRPGKIRATPIAISWPQASTAKPTPISTPTIRATAIALSWLERVKLK